MKSMNDLCNTDWPIASRVRPVLSKSKIIGLELPAFKWWLSAGSELDILYSTTNARTTYTVMAKEDSSVLLLGGTSLLNRIWKVKAGIAPGRTAAKSLWHSSLRTPLSCSSALVIQKRDCTNSGVSCAEVWRLILGINASRNKGRSRFQMPGSNLYPAQYSNPVRLDYATLCYAIKNCSFNTNRLQFERPSLSMRQIRYVWHFLLARWWCRHR